jgi:Pyridoxamine 5'-phosphate oxidase
MTSEPSDSAAGHAAPPEASRPQLPAAYRVPAGPEGLSAWRWAEARLERARTYWVATVRPDGRPLAVPVWGNWLDRRFHFGGGEVKACAPVASPAVVVHPEGGPEVVIVEGVHDFAAELSPALRARLRVASVAKYGVGGGDEAVFVGRPRTVLAWHPLLADAARWRFDSPSAPTGQ